MEAAEYAHTYQLENHHWWFVGLHELVLAHLPGKPGGSLRILDAGCGTGRLLERMSPYGACEGWDASETALEFCGSRGLTQVRQVDLNAWQPSGERFDAITSVDVLYHRNIHDEAKVVEKLHQLLEPGGRLIVHEPAFPLLRRAHDDRVMGRKRFTRGELVALLESKGFTVRRATYRLPLLFLVIVLTKLVRGLIPARDEASDLKVAPAWLNAIGLLGVRIENRLIRRGLPLYPGSSVFLVAEKS